MTPLLRCLGNICSGADEYSLQACDNPRLLHTLGTFLDSAIRHIVKECLWVLSNMAGKQFHIFSRTFEYHSKKGGKDQETIQSSTTLDQGYHMEK